MFAFWGKSYAPDDAPAMHSVPHHCLDVAAAATVLLPIFPPPINIPAASVVALIALHDVGKFTRPFQAKVQALWPTASLGPFNTPPAGYPHDQTGYALMTGPLAELIAPLFGNWTAAARQPLLRAVAGHHGRVRPLSRSERLCCHVAWPARPALRRPPSSLSRCSRCLRLRHSPNSARAIEVEQYAAPFACKLDARPADLSRAAMHAGPKPLW